MYTLLAYSNFSTHGVEKTEMGMSRTQCTSYKWHVYFKCSCFPTWTAILVVEDSTDVGH